MFSVYRVVIAIILAMIVSLSVSYGNWYLPIIAFAAAWISLFTLKNRVKEVIADERDYLIAGKASMMAMKIYIFISVTAGLVLYVLGRGNDVLFISANVLIYSACVLMVLEAFLFKIYERKNG